MILSVGEILVDRLIKDGEEISHVGGAPFNVAVHAKKSGAAVKFFGRVGADSDGEFVKKEAAKYLGGDAILVLDGKRKTTVAEVRLDKGERYFRFLRDFAADYAFEKSLPISDFSALKIIHLGTLMLNTEQGRDFAFFVAALCKEKGIYLSADANFRDGLFESDEERKNVMANFLSRCDIVKFSEEEICELTGENEVKRAAEKFAVDGIVFVTMGDKGSLAYSRKTGFVTAAAERAEKVVDTTGAGDAFFGAVLCELEKAEVLTAEKLREILLCGNACGKEAVSREGAVW